MPEVNQCFLNDTCINQAETTRIAVKLYVTAFLWNKNTFYLRKSFCNHLRSFLLAHNNSGNLIIDVSLNNQKIKW